MDAPAALPEPGQLVHLRQRRWLVEGVETAPRFGEATLVRAACVDDDAQGELVSVLWEHELDARVIADDGWRRVGAERFDDPEVFAAYARTVRWGCVTATDPSLFQAPFRAGIRLEHYQLEPLRKALQLRGVNLLIADDVGLGKTIEGGLILRELLLRQRIDFVVVAAPPSMLGQWADELETRFGLPMRSARRTACCASAGRKDRDHPPAARQRLAGHRDPNLRTARRRHRAQPGRHRRGRDRPDRPIGGRAPRP